MLLTHLETLTRNNILRNVLRSLAACALVLLCGLSLTSTVAEAQSIYTVPLFPKYQVMAVVYAPPGSASSVTYGNSAMVGSANTVISNTASTYTQSTSTTAGFSLFGFGSSTTNTTSDGWGIADQSSTTMSIQTTQGNSVTTAGPVSAALGVNHDNDIIYIWLNPVVMTTTTGITNNAIPLVWTGLQYNSCDLTDTADKVNFYQQINGCDQNQYPFADIVGIPVWCLKNPYYPGQSCAQWLPYTSRSWDFNSWGADPNTHLPLGPWLTLQDYADILQADPFVSQTLVAGNTTPGYYCHASYGVNVDPNDVEVIPASTALPLPPSGKAWPTGFCGAAGTIQRFDPFDTVEYPEPGINGQPQTYSGNFSYNTTSQFGKSATDTHESGNSTSTTTSFGFTGSFAIPGTFVPLLSAGFNFSVTSGSGQSWTSAQTNSTTNTTTTGNSAAYSITGPQLSDNYTGPTTFNTYKDNVYGTFAFYSDLQRLQSPIQLSIVSGQGPIGVSATSTFGTVQVGHSSTAQTITLTNNSPYQMTVVAPAVTFSDPGFQIVPGTDNCSNVLLSPYGTAPSTSYTCTMGVQFVPVVSDAPNTQLASYPLTVSLIAAGTENVTSYQNILVTSTGVTVAGTATPGTVTAGATLLPATQDSTQPNLYDFTTPSTYAPLTEVFTFKNYYSSSVTFAANPADIVVSDSADFSVLNVTGSLDGCSGATVVAGGTCSFTLQYLPTSTAPPSGLYGTRLTAVATVAGSTTGPAQLAIAGAAGTIGNVFSITPASAHFVQISGDYWAQVALTVKNTSGSPMTNMAIPQVYITTPAPDGYFIYGYMTGTYFAVTATCPTGTATLAPGASCTADYIFYNETTPDGTAISGSAQMTATLNNSNGSTSSVSTLIPYTATVANVPSKIKLNGAEQSTTVTTPATHARAAVTISGSVGASFTGTRHVVVTFGPFRANATYDDTATSASVATALAHAANASASPVNAEVSGDIVIFRSKVAGSAGNIAYAATDSRDFVVTAKAGSLTGGNDAVTTTKYDGGSVSATIWGVTAAANWGKMSTPASIAGGLAASLNAAANGSFTASAAGDTITLTPVSNSPSAPGVSVNVSDSKGFKPPSFTATTGN